MTRAFKDCKRGFVIITTKGEVHTLMENPEPYGDKYTALSMRGFYPTRLTIPGSEIVTHLATENFP